MAYPQRRALRLREYDYTQPGAYFVTICTRKRVCLLGDVVDEKMALNDYGLAVESCWQALSRHFPHLTLDAFVVMPNHVHGIMWLGGVDLMRNCVGAGFKPARTKFHMKPDPTKFHAKPDPTAMAVTTRHGLSEIVRAFKTFSARRINAMRGTPGTSVWQRNYYEHVIRDEVALNRIRQYIVENPARWPQDAENPIRAGLSRT